MSVANVRGVSVADAKGVSVADARGVSVAVVRDVHLFMRMSLSVNRGVLLWLM